MKAKLRFQYHIHSQSVKWVVLFDSCHLIGGYFRTYIIIIGFQEIFLEIKTIARYQKAVVICNHLNGKVHLEVKIIHTD